MSARVLIGFDYQINRWWIWHAVKYRCLVSMILLPCSSLKLGLLYLILCLSSKSHPSHAALGQVQWIPSLLLLASNLLQVSKYFTSPVWAAELCWTFRPWLTALNPLCLTTPHHSPSRLTGDQIRAENARNSVKLCFRSGEKNIKSIKKQLDINPSFLLCASLQNQSCLVFLDRSLAETELLKGITWDIKETDTRDHWTKISEHKLYVTTSY